MHIRCTWGVQCTSVHLLDVYTSPCYHRILANVRYIQLQRTFNPFMSLAISLYLNTKKEL
ncbi:hypothetical protein XBKB1_2380017 [Xenorhabdus bovienii str. kraussei Becker Underwood]|uniref:Uncharacterized protein n=1 Tax=Xenorhabdus bovienii str. kraussei Becker Underwood TaxID=1398204 RepID=A0A077PTI4_XENBV|nr:hypothetical protein XBKB1_2380017 [Xenorhabdus bovienii str. kraussei Becker Underwood]